MGNRLDVLADMLEDPSWDVEKDGVVDLLLALLKVAQTLDGLTHQELKDEVTGLAYMAVECVK